jgi:putative spermidine/putrescine transport system permease protein
MSMTMAPADPLKISSGNNAWGRAERSNRIRAFLLAVPAVAFLLVTFCIPIGAFLMKSVANPEVRAVLPETLKELQTWDGTSIPEENAFAALVNDLQRARQAGTAASLGKRLNYEDPGMRTRIMKLARAVGTFKPGTVAPQVIGIDASWGEVKTWQIIERNRTAATPYYLLTAIDLAVAPSGALVAVKGDQAIFLDVLGRTLWIAILVTIATLLLGFPTAYVISIAPTRIASVMLLMVLLPLWTSLLVRTTAWIVLLQTDGVINQVLMGLHLTGDKLQLMLTRFGTVTAMTHIQLPFTILPILAVMRSIPAGQIRAARSLGAPALSAFWRVYAPQTLPGVAAGCLMTFILSLGYYITPALVGGPRDQMISNFIATYINRDLNWGMAAALAAILLLVTLCIYILFLRLLGAERIKLG